MGAFYDEIPNESIIEWIREQKLFYVATAPLSAQHHVNVSPKGMTGSFFIQDRRSCWYIDVTGSGNETMSHLNEQGNGRITIMFNAFEGTARIIRLFGQGRVLELDSPEFNALLPPDSPLRLTGVRAIIWIDIHRVGTSCGYSVPFYEYVGDRYELDEWASERFRDDEEGRDKTGMKAYWRKKNVESSDGLPGLKFAVQQNVAMGREDLNHNTISTQMTILSKSPKAVGSSISSASTKRGTETGFWIGLPVGIALSMIAVVISFMLIPGRIAGLLHLVGHLT